MASVTVTEKQSAQSLDWSALASEYCARTGVGEDYERELQAWIQKQKGTIEILVTGKTGTGKSTLVNALVGEKIAKEGDLDPQTKEVAGYEMTVDGVEIIVWDSPGLQDGTKYEEEYLDNMTKKCGGVDLVIFCIDSSAPRSELGPGQRDFSAIQKFTATFGVKFWKNAVFVLTFGNILADKLGYQTDDVERAFDQALEDWESKIQHALKSAQLPHQLIAEIPVVPAGHITTPDLPGHERWLSFLWGVAASRIKSSSKLTLVRLNIPRLKRPSQVSQEDFKVEGHRQPIDIETAAKASQSLVHKSAGGVVGASIGAAFGSAIGFVWKGFSWAGVIKGGKVGAKVGGTVGKVLADNVEVVMRVLQFLFEYDCNPERQDL